MKEVYEFAEKNNVGSLATTENNKPRVRPVQFMFVEDDKFYFMTSNTKKMFKQMKANPFVEYLVISPETVWLRLSGEIKFSNDLEKKQKILDLLPRIKNLYKTADNPILEIFYLEHGEAAIYDFSSKAPKEFTF